MSDILSNPIIAGILIFVGGYLAKIAIDRARNRKPRRMEFSLDYRPTQKWRKLPASAEIQWSDEDLKTFDQHNRLGKLIMPKLDFPDAIKRHHGMFYVRFWENGSPVDVSTQGTTAGGLKPSGDGFYRIRITRHLS